MGMNNLSLLVCASLAALGGCSITTSTDIDPTPLAGTISGSTWLFQNGNTDAFLSEGSTDFFATFYESSFTPCGSEPSGPHVIVSIPKVAGDYSMDFSRNMTFVDGDTNLVAVDGRIVVDSVTATQVTGGLHGTYDSENEVNGQFSITVCPSGN
jgi:hypothetical protein